MIFKTRTSKKTMEIFEEIGSSEQLQPYYLAKFAVSLSIKNDMPLTEKDFHRDNNGLELNRQTITGEFDTMYKCLIEMKEGRNLTDDEYFPSYIKAHMDRGAKLLYKEFKYGRDLLIQLLNVNDNI